jgi:hypothetical protein
MALLAYTNRRNLYQIPSGWQIASDGTPRSVANDPDGSDVIGTWLVQHMFAVGEAWWAHRPVRELVQGPPRGPVPAPAEPI